jgi:hypothetical protein
MQLNLSDAQVHALKAAIDSYYSDLREEIYHTDDYDTRQALKVLEHELELIREQLEPGWLARTGADRDDQPSVTPVAPERSAETGGIPEE